MGAKALFFYDRRNEKQHSGFDGFGGSSQGNYSERNTNAKILNTDRNGSNVHDRRRSKQIKRGAP